MGWLDELRYQLRASWIVVVAAAVWACERPVQAESRPSSDAVSDAAPLLVDSILPSGEALRRFQAELPPITEFEGSAASRDDLVRSFIRALEKADTSMLRGLVVSKAEYGYLYFPSSVYSRKPYELPPEIAWLLGDQNNRKGFSRLTRRLGGKNLAFRGYECGAPATEGDNKFWRSCNVAYVDPVIGRDVTKKLFGAIMERGGRYKFLSYANDF